VGCHDKDMTLYGLYSDMAWADYLGNTTLMDTVHRRYEDVDGWRLGSSLGHVPTMGLDYLHEATLAHSFGFFRSSIFCCATALDLELKRSLTSLIPCEAIRIQRQTLGQSIRFAHRCRPSESTEERLSRLAAVNAIRNRVSVHPCQAKLLVSHDEDDSEFPLQPTELKQFFPSDEITQIEEECKTQGVPADWLEHLSAKVIWETKQAFGDGPMLFEGTKKGRDPTTQCT
jgi:hypothetical protein